MLLPLLSYIGLGALVGLIAGMFGVGGGIIFVPVFLWSFVALDLPDPILWKTAIATSHACVLIISLGSAKAHHKRGNVNFYVVKQMLPGLLLGALLIGTLLTEIAPVFALKLFFALFLLILGIRYLVQKERIRTAPISNWPGFRTAGLFVGTIASLIGIGGGSLIVPFAKWRGVGMKEAIGTSSACSVPIALASTAGLMVAGWSATHLQEWYLGYVYLPAFLGVSFASMLTTRWGAKIAQQLSSGVLTRLFGVLILCISISMLVKIYPTILSAIFAVQ